MAQGLGVNFYVGIAIGSLGRVGDMAVIKELNAPAFSGE